MCEAKPSHTIPMNISGNIAGCGSLPLPVHRQPFRLPGSLHGIRLVETPATIRWNLALPVRGAAKFLRTQNKSRVGRSPP